MPLLIAALVIIFISALLLSAYICFYKVFFVPKQTAEDAYSMPDTPQYAPYKDEAVRMIKYAQSIPYRDVWVTSHDGLRLHAKFYAAKEADAPLTIMFHGYRSVAERCFCGGLRFAVESGSNVLLVDQRAHGQSKGKYLSFGINERFDVLTWIDFGKQLLGEDVKILLYGMSMGAATVLMSTGLSLPENVVGIVSDCGYTSPAEIIKKVLRDMHLPVFPTYALIRLGGIIFGGFDADSASAEKALAGCRIPVLFIHGEDDRFVPCEMSRRNHAACACESKRLLTVPDAGHGISYMLDRDAYISALTDFTKTTFKIK